MFTESAKSESNIKTTVLKCKVTEVPTPKKRKAHLPENDRGRSTYHYNVSPFQHTVAQKTAPMFAYYVKTHVLLNADII